jgi:hypothetical protein
MPLRIHNCALRRQGELAGGKRRSEQVNKWHGRSIGLTTDRLRMVARPEVMPTSGGGAPTSARIPVKEGATQANKRPWELY